LPENGIAGEALPKSSRMRRNAAAAVVLCVRAASGLLALRAGTVPPIELSAAVLHRAQDNLAVAKTSDVYSSAAVWEARTTQQEILAKAAEASGEEAFNVARAAVPNSRVARDEARIFEAKAEASVVKVHDVQDAMKQVAGEAAVAAKDKIMEQVTQEAHASAEAANEKAQDWKKKRAERVAANVAAAIEPYHLAMLRAQKAVEVTHTKAISAAESSLKLASEAQVLASKANALQGAGLAVQAQQMMQMAHGTMQGAVNLKGWSEKMYNLANKINGGIGSYQLSEGMAAANAAATTLYNPPMDLP